MAIHIPNSKRVLQSAFIFLMLSMAITHATGQSRLRFFNGDHPDIRYTGRVEVRSDDSVRHSVRFWQPGVYAELRFRGDTCAIVLNDEVLWGNKHNYIEIVLDGEATRLRLNNRVDTIGIHARHHAEIHSLQIMKNTEANIGYLEVAGIRAVDLVQLPREAKHKIEFIGNSITCGASSDQSLVPCGKGAWEDQHNAWLSYGARTARALGARFHLSSVSGIGLMHSCCGLEILMPQVFNKIGMRQDSIDWDFSRFQPEVVTICLGQNDGIQDSAVFVDRYVAFLVQLRTYYPRARFVCLSSPMADHALKDFMMKTIDAVIVRINDPRVTRYYFSKIYNHGCDSHPDVKDHEGIATELTTYLKKITQW